MDYLPIEIKEMIFKERRNAQARDLMISQMRKPMSQVSLRHTLWAYRNCEYDEAFHEFMEHVLDWHEVWHIYYN